MWKTVLWGIPAHLLGLIAFVLLVAVFLFVRFGRLMEEMIERE